MNMYLWVLHTHHRRFKSGCNSSHLKTIHLSCKNLSKF